MSSMSTLPREFEIKERATTRIAGVLTEEDGVTPMPGSELLTFTLTVYDADTAQTLIIDHRNILNANNGAVDEDGAFVILLAPADVPIRTATLPYERHTALLEWTWGGDPTKYGREELVLVVRNLAKVG
jgi:hypothetical protein